MHPNDLTHREQQARALFRDYEPSPPPHWCDTLILFILALVLFSTVVLFATGCPPSPWLTGDIVDVAQEG